MSMQLGSLIFNEWVPDEYDLPLPVRSAASVDTNGGVAFFSWGIRDVGQKITISWDAMTKTLFESLVALMVADASVVWLPEDGFSYTVQVLDVEGTLVTTYDNAYRQKVSVVLLIVGKEALP